MKRNTEVLSLRGLRASFAVTHVEGKRSSKSLEQVARCKMAKILPGLERPDNRSQIEAAYGAFAEITYFEVIRGRDEAWATLRREVSAWNQCKESQNC